ncbi:MAG: tripartite tricarboxylate transporter substrate binding protein, partial [Planctomycetota bacterium]
PAGTPDALLDTIARNAKRAMMDEKWAKALAKDGVEAPPERTRAEWTCYIAQEHAFWGKKLKTLKIELG